eukprot:GHVN01090441.1.p3 GENE.GHVN01090441.1~~GHVN01090441.1.p3  ORF type:complete len:125 (-),score=7.12 GHVN01090441.1:1948-2322(-)
MLMFIHLAQMECREVESYVKLLAISVAVTSQCLAPWELKYTVVPILGAFSFFLVYRWRQGSAPKMEKTNGIISLMCLSAAITCFVLGLDDDNDYLRLFHGFWHLFVSLFGFFFMASSQLGKEMN